MYVTNPITSSNMPYFKVQIGSSSNEGIFVNAVKDSGATVSCLAEQLWNFIPGKDKIPITPTTGDVSVASSAPLPILFIADITITFFGKDGSTLAITHPMHVVHGLHSELYIGEDILGGPNKLFETPDTMVLSTDPSIRSTIDIPSNPQFLQVEIFKANDWRAVPFNKSVNGIQIVRDTLVEPSESVIPLDRAVRTIQKPTQKGLSQSSRPSIGMQTPGLRLFQTEKYYPKSTYGQTDEHLYEPVHTEKYFPKSSQRKMEDHLYPELRPIPARKTLSPVLLIGVQQLPINQKTVDADSRVVGLESQGLESLNSCFSPALTPGMRESARTSQFLVNSISVSSREQRDQIGGELDEENNQSCRNPFGKFTTAQNLQILDEKKP